jgi:hypothetical protein
MPKDKSKDPKRNVLKTWGISMKEGEKIFNRVLDSWKERTYKTDSIDTLFPELTKKQKYTVFCWAEIQTQKAMCIAEAKVATEIVQRMLGGIGGMGVIQATSKEELLRQIKDLEAGKPQHE